MRWFKHFSDALDDPFIQELMDEFGPAGYVAWFGLIEIVCKENGNLLTGILEIKPQFLKRKLRISVAKLEQIFNFCSGKHQEKSDKTSGKVKLLFDNTKEKWNFEFDKILILKDNYTKDLQATSKKPSNYKEVEVEKEVDKKEDKKRFAEDSNEFRISNFLYQNILKHKPDFKKPNLQTWSSDSDKLLRIDKRNIETVKKLISWVQNDSFEQSNVLSISKLRKRFDNLELKMNKKRSQTNDYHKSLHELMENSEPNTIEVTDYEIS